ncbi:MAG: hypothetical protein WA970_10320 [Gammaproteobacteria bacterium]
MTLRRSRRALWLCVAFSWVGMLLPLPVVRATSANTEAPTSETDSLGAEQKHRERGWLDVILGESGQDNFYLGMWSHHFLKDNDQYETTNNLIGISYGGYYFGTFVNSYDDRTWSGGVQRDVYGSRWRRLNLESGYRAGLLYGYDTITLGNTKLGPLFQVYADVSYRQFGLQFSWALEVVTAGFFVRLL